MFENSDKKSSEFEELQKKLWLHDKYNFFLTKRATF